MEVLAGEASYLPITPLDPRFGPDQWQMPDDLGIFVDADGTLHPSEYLGGVAGARLASLLGFAALAAHWTGEGLDRLRRDVFAQGDLSPAPRFAAAAQWSAGVRPGPVDLELRLAEVAPTRCALVALPDHVTVLIVVAEDGGAFEVQQYLLPLPAARTPPGGEFLMDSPTNIRRLELAQPYYAEDRPIPAAEIDVLLGGKRFDPLLACLAGYSLVRAGEQARYIGPLRGNRSALRNMLRFFEALPDSHVLAGLCEPERRDEHFAHALARGLPVFAEGVRALHD